MDIFRRAVTLLASTLVCSAVAQNAAAELPNSASSRSIVLAPLTGDSPLDRQIKELQAKVKSSRYGDAYLVRLGWAFVTKARVSSDPGFYKLAELCAQSVSDPDDSDALLLRGHIADSLHNFADAEIIGRKLTNASHARWESHALLGDALMEQGRLDDAIVAYQQMIDIRPCLQTYARVAHVRWLRGDLEGAIEMTQLAVKASTPRDPEPAAWAYTRLGLYQLQAGNIQEAAWSAKRALEFLADYPAALILQARVFAYEGNNGEALPVLKRAVAAAPLPENQWFLADVARSLGDEELAAKAEATIKSRGKGEDLRSFALFLATRNQNPAEALAAARQELGNRSDIFTHDAIAWSALAAGDLPTAKTNIEQALAEKTNDARLFYHAGKIAVATADRAIANEMLAKSVAIQQMLLPSERADLLRAQEALKPAVNPLTSTADNNMAATGRN